MAGCGVRRGVVYTDGLYSRYMWWFPLAHGVSERVCIQDGGHRRREFNCESTDWGSNATAKQEQDCAGTLDGVSLDLKGNKKHQIVRWVGGWLARKTLGKSPLHDGPRKKALWWEQDAIVERWGEKKAHLKLEWRGTGTQEQMILLANKDGKDWCGLKLTDQHK